MFIPMSIGDRRPLLLWVLDWLEKTYTKEGVFFALSHLAMTALRRYGRNISATSGAGGEMSICMCMGRLKKSAATS